jgi:hypothetical protein
MKTLGLWILALLPLGLTGCLRWPESATHPHPDEVLWTRAMLAFEGQRCDVANITLQTLINTYPDSKYAEEANYMFDNRLSLHNCESKPVTGDSTSWTVGISSGADH